MLFLFLLQIVKWTVNVFNAFCTYVSVYFLCYAAQVSDLLII